MSWISFGILITGRFLTYYFAGFLVLTIRCYFETEVCDQPTDVARFSLSIFSIILSIFFNNLYQFYQHVTFPLERVPWAKPESLYKILHTVRMLLNAICLSLMDLINGPNGTTLSYYLILTPFFLIQSTLLYLHFSQETCFDKLVARAHLVIDSLQWGFITTAILVELLQDDCDISIVGVAFALSFTAGLVVYLLKKRRNSQFLRDPTISNLNSKD